MPHAVTFSTTLSTVLMIVRPPGDPVTQHDLAVLRATIAGVIELSMRLPGAMRFAGVPMSPVRFGRARLLVEVAHLVVEQDARALDDDVRSVAAFERVGVRDGHAVLVDHREVRRLVRTRTACGTVTMSLPSSTLLEALRERDRLRQIARVRFAVELGDRHLARSRDRPGSARDRGTRAASLR